MPESINNLSACEMMARVGNGTLTVRQIVEALLRRISAREPAVRAWQHLDPAQLLAEATRLDSIPRAERGPLHGLLFAAKDVFDTADMPTTYGSEAYRDNRPASDSSAVAILRSKGALLVGKTVSTEFATWAPSVTRNPCGLEHTPGGSSSGSAAAVADAMVPVALGTQTLGSVLRPASYCGIVGFKPSYGRINRAGVKPLAESLDTVGILARGIEDAEMVYRALSDSRPLVFDAQWQPRSIAFCSNLNWDRLDAGARQAANAFIASLRKAGIRVDEIELPHQFEKLESAAKTIHDFEAWRGFAFERSSLIERCSASFRDGIADAQSRTVDDYEAAVRLGAECRAQFDEVMRSYQAFITLSATGEAPAGLSSTGNPVMNSPGTLLHAACVSIPVLHGESGLPIGLQVIAPQFADDAALRTAHWLLRFHQRVTQDTTAELASAHQA